MTTSPSPNPDTCNREEACQAACDETQIKRLEAAISSTDICQKALEVLRKRMVRGEVSDHMLLRVVVSLSKSTAILKSTADEASVWFDPSLDRVIQLLHRFSVFSRS